MAKKSKRGKLVQKADKIFSEYIRRRNADIFGTAECVTCGKKDHWKQLQCGHFQSRKHYATRWDETNCQVQCSGCNVFRYGEQYKFSLFLEKEYGAGTSEELAQKASGIVKLSNFDLEYLILHYKNLLSNL